MTVAAQPQPSRGGNELSSVDVPSLMARSRQAGGLRAPTRERVSEAIALVRARQAAENKRTAMQVQDVSELRSAVVSQQKTGISTHSDSSGNGSNSNLRSPLVPAGQTGPREKKRHHHHQPKKVAIQSNNFLQNVFASRSDVTSTVQADSESIPSATSTQDEPEENVPGPIISSGFMNPLEFVKREIQLATQSASRGQVATPGRPKKRPVPSSSSSPSAPARNTELSAGVDSADSEDSYDDAPVDPKTISDVTRFLDKLNIKKSLSSLDQTDSVDSYEQTVDAKTIQDVSTFLDSLNIKTPNDYQRVLGGAQFMESDAIRPLRNTLSDDFIFGSTEDDDDYSGASSNGSVNPETLAEIGAYIDSVSKGSASLAGPSVLRSMPGISGTSGETMSKTQTDAPTFVEPGDFSVHEEVIDLAVYELANNMATESASYDHTVDAYTRTALSAHDDVVSLATKSVTFGQVESRIIENVSIDDDVQNSYAIEDELALIRSYSNSSNDSSDADATLAQTRVSKPSPIYEQVEAKSLPRGASRDPPAVITSRGNTPKVDPPGPSGNMNDAVMRMHESHPMAPSYSAESLESGNIFSDDQQVTEEEKKAEDEMDGVESSVDMTSIGASGQNLAPLIEHPSAESATSDGEEGDDYDAILDNALGEDVVNATASATQPESPAGNDAVIDEASPQHERSEIESQSESVETDSSSPSELVDDAGVPIRMQLAANESEEDNGRYDVIEADRSEEMPPSVEVDTESETSDLVSELPNTGIRNLPNSPSMKDDNSLPWDLKDIASEETMKAAGRTRTAALNPASRSKARKLTSLLSDDTSVAQSTAMDSDQASESDEKGAYAAKNALADESELDEQKANMTFEEGEDGVEIFEDGPVCEEHDSKTSEIPRAPSGEDETANPAADPSGRTLDEKDDVKPKPDPAGDGQSEADSAEDFVECFLQQGSLSANSNDDDRQNDRNNLRVIVNDPRDKFATKLSDHYSPVTSSPAHGYDEGGPGFLEQFESLEVDDDEKIEEGSFEGSAGASHSYPAAALSPVNLFTLPGIFKYFAHLNARSDDETSDMAQNIKFFQRLVAPIVAGAKPSIIETAQIRQAAQRVNIPMEVVDRFLDLVEDERANIPDVLSSQSEILSVNKYEDMEDLNEDDAITAFLTRFGTLHQGGHFPNADVGFAQDFVQQLSGGADEAVEVDAQYGFVNKKMALQVIEDEEDEPEWWTGGQKQTNPTLNIHLSGSCESGGAGWSTSVGSVDNSEKMASAIATEGKEKGAQVSPKPCKDLSSRPLARDSTHMKTYKDKALVVNTKYYASLEHDYEEWLRRKNMATYGAGWDSHATWLSPRAASIFTKPKPIDGVAAAENIRRFVFSKKLFRNHHPWRRLYKERTQYHPGFFDVDVHSIYESTAVCLSAPLDEEDYIPWEHREVQQRFLQEKSYTFSRNWFGDLVRKRGNQKIKAPICKPKSMEMPIENVPDPGEWTKEWFTQWKSPADRQSRSYSASKSFTTDGTGTYTDADTYTDNGTYTDRDGTDEGSHTENGSYTDGSTRRDDDADESSSYTGSGTERSDSESDGSASWEEAPECGELINVRQKIGERVTRVHPDYTSSLRRSRWRKKYFPRGTFPY